MFLRSWTVFTGLKIFTAHKDGEKKVKDKSSRGGRRGEERKQSDEQKEPRPGPGAASPGPCPSPSGPGRGQTEQPDRPTAPAAPSISPCPQSWGAWGRAGGPQQTYRQTHSRAKPDGHQASLATKPPRGRSSAQGSYKPWPCAACCPSEGWGPLLPPPKNHSLGQGHPLGAALRPPALSLLPRGTAAAPGPGGPHGFSSGAASSGRLCIVTLRGGGGHGASPPAPLATPEQRWGSARLRFAPRCGEHRQQQLPATAPCPSQPWHGVGGTTPSPAAAPRCPLGPGSRQQGGTGDTRWWGGPRDRRRVTQTDRHQRYILFFVCVLFFFFAAPGPWHRRRGQSPERGAWEGH